MRLYVGPLPDYVDQKDVRAFVESAIRPKGFLRFLEKKTGPVTCTMMQSQRPGSLPVYFAVVHVHPHRRALRAIAALNGTAIRGGVVRVRRFIVRNPANDRRRNISLERPSDRRRRERRGYALLRVGAANRLGIAPLDPMARGLPDQGE